MKQKSIFCLNFEVLGERSVQMHTISITCTMTGKSELTWKTVGEETASKGSIGLQVILDDKNTQLIHREIVSWKQIRSDAITENRTLNMGGY